MDTSLLRNHNFLMNRNKGSSRRLRGNVLMELVYVEDRDSTWEQSEKDRFFSVFKSAMMGINGQAADLGVELLISAISGKYVYTGEIDGTNIFSDVIPSIYRDYMGRQGFGDTESFFRSRKNMYGMDELAVVFVIEERFRAYAMTGGTMEYCVLTNDSDAHAIGHEMLHLFGAADLYYPYQVWGLTMEYFPNTIMCTYEGMEVDPLTQFLVGWRDDLSPKAREFMGKLEDYTVQRGREALTIELYRGRESELLQALSPFASMGDLQQKAEDGNPWAEFLLGLCLRDGLGIEKDPAKAELLFRRSGRTGLTIAAAAHGQMILCRGIKRERDKEDLRLLLQYNFYYHLKLNALQVACRFYGIAMPKEPERAVESALAQYGTDSQYHGFAKRSALLYRIAEKLSSQIYTLYKAVVELRHDYDKMLEQGDPDLQYFVAMQKETGKYMKRDLQGAYKLYEKSGQMGNYLAWEALACGRWTGLWDAEEPEYARAWLAMAKLERSKHPWDAFCHIIEEQN